MKLRKVLTIVLIALVFFTTVSFANTRISVNATKRNTENSNSVNNVTDEIPEDELIPALEEKLKENNKSNKETSTNSNTSTKENIFSNSNTNIFKSNVKNDKEAILDDIYKFSDESLEYKDVSVKGNVYIVSDNNILIENSEIYGNVFIITKNIELNNTKVSGSIYIISTESTNIINSDINSAYVLGERVNIDEESKIETDLRAGGGRIYISGDIERNVYISSEYVRISDEAKITGKCEVSVKEYDISENIDFSENLTIKAFEYKAPTIQELLPELLTEFAIILVVSIFILGGAPKFTEVNLRLSRFEFIKAFFTGIIELVVICAVAVGIMIWGFGIGYSVALLILTFTIISLGKIIFILAYSIRMIRKARRTSRRKAFVAEVFVALAVQAIGLIAIFGDIGYAVSVLIDLVLGIVGFGTLVRVLLTPRAKTPKKEKNDVKHVEEKIENAAPTTEQVPQVSTQIPNFENSSIILQAKEVRIENVGKIEIIDKKEEPVKIEEPEVKNVIEEKTAVVEDVESKEVAPENENIDNKDNEENSNKE